MNQPLNSKGIFSDKKTKKLVIGLLALIALLIISIVWQNVEYENQMALKMEYIEQKNALRDDLDDLIDEHELLKDENLELSDQLYSKDSLIKAYSNDIKKLLRSEVDLNKARVKISRLKAISKKYINAMDSLLVLNESLKMENDSVKQVNKRISSKNRDLIKTNRNLFDKVSLASALQVSDISVEGLYYRASGREVKTNRANKVQKFKICYSILENQIAEADEKELFVRILNSGGQVLNISNIIQEIELSDTTLQYSTSFTFDYQNELLSECQLWTRGNVLKAGVYTFEFLIDKNLVGFHQVKFR